MWYKLIASALLFAGISSAIAQEKDEAPRAPKNEDIIIRKKGSSKNEKTTIVIDGDNITINGKPVDEFKSANIELLRGKHESEFGAPWATIAPHINVLSNGNFFTNPNKAFLGVGSRKVDNGAKISSITKGSPAEKR